MTQDTLALKLYGDVELSQLAEALTRFNKLVEALTDDVTDAAGVKWEVVRLETGSAIAGVRGRYSEPALVERVVEAYTVIGYALAHRRPIPYSDEVASRARALIQVLDKDVRSLGFIVDDKEVAVVDEAALDDLFGETEHRSFGALTGVVDTLRHRPNLRMTLYEALFDKAVFCYLSAIFEDTAREAWGKSVEVIGEIVRDPLTGRPLKVQQIQKVNILRPPLTRSFEEARGVLPPSPTGERAEETIRRIRDGED